MLKHSNACSARQGVRDNYILVIDSLVNHGRCELIRENIFYQVSTLLRKLILLEDRSLLTLCSRYQVLATKKSDDFDLLILEFLLFSIIRLNFQILNILFDFPYINTILFFDEGMIHANAFESY